MNGPDIVGLRGGASAWSLLGLSIVGAIAIIGGFIAGFVAWIGALLNTWQLESRTLFAVLLVLGSPEIATQSSGAQDAGLARRLWAVLARLTGIDSPLGMAVAV